MWARVLVNASLYIHLLSLSTNYNIDMWIHANISDQVVLAKDAISEYYGFPQSQLNLVFAGKILPDHASFQSVNIPQDSVVYVTVKPSYRKIEKFDISVDLNGMNHIQIFVDEIWTVGELSRVISTLINLEHGSFDLLYNNSVLHSLHTLSYYGITGPAKIQLVLNIGSGENKLKKNAIGQMVKQTLRENVIRKYQSLIAEIVSDYRDSKDIDGGKSNGVVAVDEMTQLEHNMKKTYITKDKDAESQESENNPNTSSKKRVFEDGRSEQQNPSKKVKFTKKNRKSENISEDEPRLKKSRFN